MISPDNKAMKARCTKLLRDEPALDLLPRTRYMIDLDVRAPAFVPSARLLFDLGLHLVPIVEQETQMVTNIVAINLSDKIVRMFNGMSLSDDDYNLPSSALGGGSTGFSPPPEGRSEDGGSGS